MAGHLKLRAEAWQCIEAAGAAMDKVDRRRLLARSFELWQSAHAIEWEDGPAAGGPAGTRQGADRNLAKLRSRRRRQERREYRIAG
jgi:hypothetical protein